jgi:hypothetical protein
LPRVTRRRLLAGTGATIAAGTLAGSVSAQPATPRSGGTLDEFRALCERVTGLAPIDDDAGLTQLLDLMADDEQFAVGIEELQALGEEPLDTRTLSMPALVTATNILQFWYLGSFRNEPVANRDERFAGLLSWRTLPYVTNQTVCKGLGYWATEPDFNSGSRNAHTMN